MGCVGYDVMKVIFTDEEEIRLSGGEGRCHQDVGHGIWHV